MSPKHSIKNKTKISAIIFDWGGVFSRSGDPLKHPKLTGKINMDLGTIIKRLGSIIGPFSKGKISSEEYWKKYAELLNIHEVSPEELRKHYLSFTPDPVMINLLKSITSKHKVALLSNLNIDMKTAIIEKLKIDRYFKHMVFSNDVGLLKPDSASFKLVLKLLGTSPAETIFIDDEKENIEAAEKLGLRTILFASAKQCRAELKRFKII